MKAENNFEARKNKAQIYDGYFGGQYQKLHNYNNADIRDTNNPRFFGPVLPKDSENIQSVARSGLAKLQGDTFTLVDHGSGDGRNFGEVLKIAKEAKKKGKNVHYIAYDISSGGLEKFKQRLGDYNQHSKDGSRFDGLESVKFKEIKKEISDLGYGGYRAGSAVNGNLTVTFVHNDENDKREHSKKLIGQIDMVMSVFGPLSHITKESERLKALSTFNEMLGEGEGSIYATIPSKRRFTKEQEAFGMLRDMKRAPDDVVEDDVVLYKRPDGTVLPYKLYTEKSIKSEFEKAGFEDPRVGISNAIHQDTLFKYAMLAQVESCLTSIIPGLPAELGNYMYVIASAGKSKDLSKCSSNVSATQLVSDSSTASAGNSKYEFEGIKDIVIARGSRSPSHVSSLDRESSGSNASTLSTDHNDNMDISVHEHEHKRHLSGGTVEELTTKRNRSGSISKPSIKSKSWSSGLATGADTLYKKDNGPMGK